MMRLLRLFVARRFIPYISLGLFIGTVTGVLATGITDATSTGGTVTITNPTGPTTNFEVTTLPPTAANPSGTAGPTAVNGSAATFMRSDAAPAVQKAGSSTFGIMEPDGSTITCPSGVCSSANTTILSVETPTFTTGSYTLAIGDANKRILVASKDGGSNVNPANVALLLPTNTGGSPFAPGTVFEIHNQSDATAVPIATVASSEASLCPTNQCGSTTQTFNTTQHGSGHLISLTTSFCGDASCNTTAAPTIAVSDTLGNTCAATVNQVGNPNNATRTVIYNCPNSVSSGSDTWTLLFSTAPWYLAVDVKEDSGAATSSPMEGANGGNGTGTAFSVTLASATTQRNDEIMGNAGGVGPGSLPFVPWVSGSADFSTYYQASGTGQFNANWTASTLSNWVGAIAAAKAALPETHLWICQAAGTSTINGVPTTTTGTPSACGSNPGFLLTPGSWAIIRVDASDNYSVVASKIERDANEVIASSPTLGLEQCDENSLIWSNGGAQTVTIPGTLPQPCDLQMTQIGTTAAQILAGTGMNIHAMIPSSSAIAGLSCAAGPAGGQLCQVTCTNTTPNTCHTGGQYSGMDVAIGGLGQYDVARGAVAQ